MYSTDAKYWILAAVLFLLCIAWVVGDYNARDSMPRMNSETGCYDALPREAYAIVVDMTDSMSENQKRDYEDIIKRVLDDSVDQNYIYDVFLIKENSGTGVRPIKSLCGRKTVNASSSDRKKWIVLKKKIENETIKLSDDTYRSASPIAEYISNVSEYYRFKKIAIKKVLIISDLIQNTETFRPCRNASKYKYNQPPFSTGRISEILNGVEVEVLYLRRDFARQSSVYGCIPQNAEHLGLWSKYFKSLTGRTGIFQDSYEELSDAPLGSR
jgi:hypothetical protein